MLLHRRAAARIASTQFATALVNHNPKLGPKGAADYLDGILANVGPIRPARVIDTRNTSHGRGDSATTWFVGDVLLETAKGFRRARVEKLSRAARRFADDRSPSAAASPTFSSWRRGRGRWRVLSTSTSTTRCASAPARS
jgi:hypothetical protein